MNQKSEWNLDCNHEKPSQLWHTRTVLHIAGYILLWYAHKFIILFSPNSIANNYVNNSYYLYVAIPFLYQLSWTSFDSVLHTHNIYIYIYIYISDSYIECITMYM